MPPRLVEYKKEHAEWIFENNLRKEDLLGVDREVLQKVAEDWEMSGPAWSLLDGEKVVGCGGIVLQEWRKGTAWLLLSGLFYDNVRVSYRLIRTKLQEVVKEYGLRRVDMYVVASQPKSVSFAEHLGFELEGCLKAFGPNGEDYFILGRVY